MVLSVERRDQRRLIDHRAARDVDDIAVLAELLQDIGVDGVMGVGAGANRDHQHAAPFRQRFQARQIPIRHIMPAAAEIADLGLERRDARGDLAADLAHAVDADAAAADCPAAGASAAMVLPRPSRRCAHNCRRQQPPRHRQHQRDRDIGH